MSPRYPIRPDLVSYFLRSLESYKEDNGLTWDKVASLLGIHKRTILRWKKKEKMSWCYLQLAKHRLEELQRR